MFSTCECVYLSKTLCKLPSFTSHLSTHFFPEAVFRSVSTLLLKKKSSNFAWPEGWLLVSVPLAFLLHH